MPQNNVIPDWKATYPHDAPAQKPGGVTVSTALGANAVPNKPTPWQGTETIVTALGVESVEATAEEEEEGTSRFHAAVGDEDEVEEEGESEEGDDTDENGHPKPRRKTSRTVVRRTTHRR